MSTIRIISTGGTIDSLPDYGPTGKSVFRGTNVPAMIQQARLESVVLEPLMQKDSADITDDDRRRIYERCRESPETRIVITHGTDTMVETARFLAERELPGKTIALAGSFVPFSQERSDALFNLGYAIAAAQLLPPGVWIALNGDVFAWDNVRKNREKGRFERINNSTTR